MSTQEMQAKDRLMSPRIYNVGLLWAMTGMTSAQKQVVLGMTKELVLNLGPESKLTFWVLGYGGKDCYSLWPDDIKVLDKMQGVEVQSLGHKYLPIVELYDLVQGYDEVWCLPSFNGASRTRNTRVSRIYHMAQDAGHLIARIFKWIPPWGNTEMELTKKGRE
jgi:hypothetical protein